MRRASSFRPSLAAFVLFVAMPAYATVIGFEDVAANLPIGSDAFYSGESAYDPGDPDATDWTSGGAVFNNEFMPFFPGCCWQGFAYSQTTDTVTGGPGNQYSAIPGSGSGGSATYAVGYTGSAQGASDISTILFSQEMSVLSADITNTTYAFDSMTHGDGFAKQFGGVDGDDPDWLLLTITGYDAQGAMTGSVDFYLADFRSANGADDYIVSAWTTVDLTSLGAVQKLDFSIDGSDAEFGFVNTPTYFALDNLVVPEPGTGALLALGLGLLAVRRRR